MNKILTLIKRLKKYTTPIIRGKKLIIVGCDITNNIRIGENEEHSLYKDLNILEEWKYFLDIIHSKRFKKNVEIKAFKPLGLKGLIPEFVPNT